MRYAGRACFIPLSGSRRARLRSVLFCGFQYVLFDAGQEFVSVFVGLGAAHTRNLKQLALGDRLAAAHVL